jgi:V8-like Glu-specific endopeptidase
MTSFGSFGSFKSSVVLSFLVCVTACSSPKPGGASAAASPLQVDQIESVTGVDDEGRDPAVVALDVGEGTLCTGTLIAPDVVLTARHCVSVTAETIACPSTAKQIIDERPPSSLHVLVGDSVATAREVARGAAVVVPPGDTLCDADIALVVLDQGVDIDPLDVSAGSVAAGDHVTAIGFGRRADGDPPGTKLFREHVEVLSVSPNELLVGEATCQGDSGGPALDEATGEIVGVVSRGGPTCDGAGAHNVYTRTGAFLPLIARALAMSAGDASLGGAGDAGADASAPKKAPKKTADGGTTKPPSDMGNTCATAVDCGTGVCVTDEGKQYCSRSCGTGDRCPAHYHCTATSLTQKVCIQVPAS